MESILDHTGVNVTDFARSRAFYEKALAPLGIAIVKEYPKACGFGIGKPELWVVEGKASYQTAEQIAVITPIHIAVKAKTRAAVDAFYSAAIAAGGKDFGAPGVRPHYHESYYGAFVLDPDGHNIEAVCHG